MSGRSWARIALLALAIIACGALLRVILYEGSRWVGAGLARAERARLEALGRRPPKLLPVGAEDYRRYPRDGFGFVFENNVGDRIDTFAGTCRTELRTLPDTTIALRLTETDLDSIYEVMIRMHFFDPRQRFESVKVSNACSPPIVLHLFARAGTVTRELTWDVCCLSSSYPNRPDDQKRLIALTALIRRRIDGNSEYRKLPRPRGALR